MLYQKQLDNERLLIQLSSKMANLDNLPRRVHDLEMAQAKNLWIEKVAYLALAAGIGAVITAMISSI